MERDGPLTIARRQPWRDLAHDGIVRVREYHCTACAGDPPQQEQFRKASISIVCSGHFGVRSEQGTQLLASGFLLIGNEGQQYEAFHDHAGGDRCLVFEFERAAFEQFTDSVRRGAGRRSFAKTVLPPLPRVDVLRQLAEERLGPGVPAIGLEELGLSLAAYVLQASGRGTARPSQVARDDARTRERIFAAIQLLERSVAEELHIQAVSESIGLSPFHFLRLFKRQTGVTPYQFLMRSRIRRAIQLLRVTERPVTEIAYDVGFGDLSNFINTFRRETGCSPRQFRKVLPSSSSA